jgi:hypothetical protein
VIFWSLFATIAFCFALVAIVNSGLIFNGTTKTMCTFGAMPGKFSNYTSNIDNSITTVASVTKTALDDVKVFTDQATALGPKLGNLDVAVTKLICPKWWDTTTCTDTGTTKVRFQGGGGGGGRPYFTPSQTRKSAGRIPVLRVSVLRVSMLRVSVPRLSSMLGPRPTS